MRQETREKLLHGSRNDRLYDIWSLVHALTGVLVGWVFDPFVGLFLMILWEPVEIFVLHPVMLRFGVVFGYESWRNSISDIIFDAVGVGVGYYGLRVLMAPPFCLWPHCAPPF